MFYFYVCTLVCSFVHRRKSGRTLKVFIFSHEANKRFLLFLCAFFHVNKMNGAVMSISSWSCVLIALDCLIWFAQSLCLRMLASITLLICPESISNILPFGEVSEGPFYLLANEWNASGESS